MNFANGKIITADECDFILENIGQMIIETMSRPALDIHKVIVACDTMARNIESLDAVKKLPELGVNPALAEMYMKQIRHMFGVEAIKTRLKSELGCLFDTPAELTYLHSNAKAVQKIFPLGVLFHITAGNVDGLPFVSLLDGLLTGNINIVKLPKEEGGITVSLLAELIKIEPSIAPYVYVFDYSSKDLFAMETLADVSDAIIIWGGDEAVSSVRKMAKPNTKIIEWGHKISFAYVTKEAASETALEKLALNICLTNQLFCSSCQGIFLDTEEMQDIFDFCEKFLPILEKTAQSHLAPDESENIFIQAKITLDNYHRQIESLKSGTRIFKGKYCSVTAQRDSKLETSAMYKNLWVKPLPRKKILS
ncbi:MAG: acyl-CoA reductase, partial [Clostridiales bacterium]|nr:acyl-CoA reductase [Clostridiales bacterium]